MQRPRCSPLLALSALSLFLAACGGGSSSPPPPPPPSVAIAIAPTTANINAGLSQAFTATVTNTSNTAVTWQVNSITGGSAAVGTITAQGLYTAPATPPAAAVVVAAIAQADATKSATASVTVLPAVAVAVSPAAPTVNAGLSQSFTATVANAANQAVTWQVNGVTGGSATVGTITAQGVYTAPAAPPSGAVTVAAVAQADPSKSANASVTVAPAVAVRVAPATATVNTGLTQSFTATVANAANQAVTWQVNGVAGGSATVGTITAQGVYTAPATPPAGAVTVQAVAQADPSKSASASVTVAPAVAVTVAPATVIVAVSTQQQFTATVSNTGSTGVSWQVNGVAGGNTAVGTVTAQGLYTAPATLPSGAVTVTAISSADSTKSAAANVTVAPPITVAISPSTSLTVAAGAGLQFSATVANTSNTAVTWEVDAVAGGNAAIGTISAQGLYTAPPTPPLSGAVRISAVSQEDSTKAAAVVAGVTFSNVSLEGTYVLTLSGFDANNKYFTAIALLQADGKSDSNGFGHLTGTEEVVSNGAYSTTALAAGCCTYKVLADGRGGVNITGPAGTATYAVSMSGGQNAMLTDFEANTSIQGVLQWQDPAAIASLGGAYVFGAPAAVGLLNAGNTVAGAGTLAGSEDIASNGSLLSDLSLAGSYTLGSGGRGTATWTTTQGTVAYSLYIVDADHLQLMSTDPANAGLVSVTRQQAPVTALSGNYVFTNSGQTGAQPPGALNATGQFVINNQAQVSDGVVDGAVGAVNIVAAPVTSGGYTAMANGEFRLTLAAASVPWNAAYVIWMASPSFGELMEVDSNGFSRGAVTQQTGAPFAATALTGVFGFRWSGSPNSGATSLQQGWIAAAKGNALATADILFAGTPAPNQALTGTYSIADTTHGRATMTLQDAKIMVNGSPLTMTVVAYLIAPTATASVPTRGSAFLVQGATTRNWSGQLFQQY